MIFFNVFRETSFVPKANEGLDSGIFSQSEFNVRGDKEMANLMEMLDWMEDKIVTAIEDVTSTDTKERKQED